MLRATYATLAWCGISILAIAASPANAQRKPAWPVVVSQHTSESQPALRGRPQNDPTRKRSGIPLMEVGEGDLPLPVLFNPSRPVEGLPAGTSDAIVIGTVAGATATFLDDEREVVSEFPVQVHEVLKSPAATPVTAGSRIVVDRPGGAVRFANGRTYEFTEAGVRPLEAGVRYLLFLRDSHESVWRVITAYGLTRNGVSATDGIADGPEGDDNVEFTRHNGRDNESLIRDVRDSLAGR